MSLLDTALAERDFLAVAKRPEQRTERRPVDPRPQDAPEPRRTEERLGAAETRPDRDRRETTAAADKKSTREAAARKPDDEDGGGDTGPAAASAAADTAKTTAVKGKGTDEENTTDSTADSDAAASAGDNSAGDDTDAPEQTTGTAAQASPNKTTPTTGLAAIADDGAVTGIGSSLAAATANLPGIANGQPVPGPASQASAVAQAVRDALSADTDSAPPEVKATLLDVLRPGGIRVTTNGGDAITLRPLVDAGTVAAAGVDERFARFAPGGGDNPFTNNQGGGQPQTAAGNTPQPAVAGGQPQAVPFSSDLGLDKALPTTKADSGSLGSQPVPTLANSITGTDALAGSLTTGNPSATGQNAAAQATARMPAPPPYASDAAAQVSVQIAKAIGQGVDRISIQLDPADLGRVDIKLDISKDGVVVARVTADRAETLDALQRDQRDLVKALQQAGLKTDSGSLSFDMRQDGGQAQADSHHEPGGLGVLPSSGNGPENEMNEALAMVADRALGNGTAAADGRLDIRV